MHIIIGSREGSMVLYSDSLPEYSAWLVLPRWDLKINVHSVTIICSTGGKLHNYLQCHNYLLLLLLFTCIDTYWSGCIGRQPKLLPCCSCWGGELYPPPSASYALASRLRWQLSLKFFTSMISYFWRFWRNWRRLGSSWIIPQALRERQRFSDRLSIFNCHVSGFWVNPHPDIITFHNIDCTLWIYFHFELRRVAG